MPSLRMLLSLDEAQARLLALAPSLPLERVPLQDGLGRTLGRGVEAHRTLPLWDNAAMDGYAVRADDTRGAPVTLRVLEAIHAGQQPQKTLTQGTCSRIMTGAPLPPGANAVVMLERTREVQAEHAEVQVSASAGQFVRVRGEDTQAGAPLLPAGSPLGLAEAALLWSQGVLEVDVPRRPRVAVLSNGDELCRPEEVTEDKLVDTNGPTLSAALTRAGAEVTFLGLVPDDEQQLRTRLEQAAAGGFDLVLSSAGVSLGDRDFVRTALESLGVTLDFWKVAIKPGKPLTVGRKGTTLFLGLPGNPASSLVGFELFVRPLVRKLLGHEAPLPTPQSARLALPLQKPAGLTHLLRARSIWKDGDAWAEPLPQQGSGLIRSLVSATHLLVVPAEVEHLETGDRVKLFPVHWDS